MDSDTKEVPTNVVGVDAVITPEVFTNVVDVDAVITPEVSTNVVDVDAVIVKTEDVAPTPKLRSWLNLKISVIEPDNSLYGYWQIFMLISITVGCVITVYQALVYSGDLSSWVIVYFVDVLNLVDTVLTVNVGFYDKRGNLVEDRYLIWRRYLKSFFFVNVASLLPIEVFSLKFTLRVMCMARLRMNRLIGLVKAYNIIDDHKTSLDSNGTLWQLVLCIFMATFSLHISAGVWFAVACTGYHEGVKFYCYNGTWAHIIEVIGNYTPEKVIATAPAVENYLVSLYFVVMSSTTTGFGDIAALTLVEELLSILIMLLGVAVFYGLILGLMSSLVTNLLKQKSSFLHRISTIQFRLKFRNISEQVQTQVIGYYEYLYLKKHADTSNSFLSILPDVMKVEFSYSTNLVILKKAKIFSDVDLGFLRMLSLKMKQVVYLPQQIVVTRAETGYEMVYIHRGELEILSEEDDETPIIILKEGKLFGEVNLYYSAPRVATVRARTHCDLVLLYKKDLDELMVHYPEVAKQIATAVRQRCRIADEKAGIIGETDNDEEEVQYEGMRRRTTSFIPTRAVSPGRQVVLRMSNRIHDRVFRMKKRAEKSINFSLSVEVIPVTLDDEPPSWREAPGLMIQKTLEDLIFLVKHTVFDPASSRYILWNDTMAVVILFLSILYPYMAFFSSDYDAAYLTTVPGGVIIRITYCLELLLILDIFVTLRTAIVTPNGKLSKFKYIVKHYVKTWVFVCDIFSSLPLEIFYVFWTTDFTRHYAFGILKLNRLLKFYRVSRALAWRELSPKYSDYAVRYTKLILYTLMTSHWAACMLYAGSCTSTRCSDGWILNWALERKSPVEDLAIQRYIISLYTAIVTLTNTGFGDRFPMNTKERAVTIVIMISGFLVFGYGLSLLSATITHADSFRTVFQERLFAVSNFMKEHGLNKALRKRVIRYFAILWEIYGGEWFPGDESLLHEMPINVQMDINMEDIGPVLKELPLFRHIDDSFIKAVAHRLVPYIFSAGEFIMYAKEPAEEMYIILKGHCERLSVDHKKVLSELGPGEYFGATSMLYKEYKTSSVRTKTCCEVYELKMSTLLEVLADFPAIEKHFKRVMSNRSVLESKAQVDPMAQGFNIIYPIQKTENTLISKLKLPKLVRLRNSLGVVSYKKSDMRSDDEDYETPFKRLNKCSWLLSRFLMRHTLTPGGNLLLFWTIMMTVIGGVVAGLTPIHIAFEHHSITMWIFLYTLDAISLIHVYIIGPNTGYYNEERVLVLHPLATASHYLKTNFLLDLFGCLPYELILLAVYREPNWDVLHFMALLRINRMLQFYRVILAFDYLEKDVYRRTINLRKIKYLIYLCLFVSFMAALLFFSACLPTLFISIPDPKEVLDHQVCSASSWIFSRSDLNEIAPSTFHLFTISLYLSSTIFSSVGYGDFSAKSEHETVIFSIVILAGQLFFTYILASITACVASADAQLARFKERMLHVKSYMEAEMIDPKLQNRVIAYYEHLWLMTKGVQPHTLFSVLPLSLWSDVTLSLYEDVISSISLFRDTERSFIKTISRCIKPVIFLKGEFIVKKFDIGREMYFIHRGAVDVVSEDGGTVYDTMNVGQAFGEVALLFSVPRTASIRAQVNTYLFMLEKEDLDTVLEFYPAIKHQIMRIAEDRQQQARKRSALTGPNSSKDDARVANDDVLGVQTDDLTDSGAGSKNVDDEEGEVWIKLDDANLDSLEIDSEPLSSTIWGKAIGTVKKITGKTSAGPKTSPPSPKDDGAKGKPKDNINKNNPKETQKNDQDEGKDIAVGKPRSFINIINPKSKFFAHFRVFMCSINLLSCILISYQAAFQDLSIELFAISYFFDMWFIFKIFIGFHLAYYDAYGDLIDNPIKIRQHYLRSVGGFPVELITVFPFEILALAAPHDKQLSFLAYIRVTHLLKLYSIKRLLNKLSEDLSSSMLLIKIISSLVSFTCVVHFVACMWYMITCNSEIPCHNSYMDRLIRLTSIDGKAPHKPTPAAAYLVSMYWSVATSTSTGYGDVLPGDTLEFWYTIAVLIITRLQIGFIIGDLTSVLASVGAGRAEYKEHLDLFKTVLADRRAPRELERQMVRYYNHLWLYSKGVDVRTLLKDLPICLRAEIMETVAEDFWKSVPFFHDANQSFCRLVSLYTGQLVFTKGNYIVFRGDLASDLYFIKHGEVEDITDESNPKILKEGQLFGVVGMLTNSTYVMTVRARSAVVILTLSYMNLCKVLTNYPTVEQRTKDFAKRVYNIDFKLPDPDADK